MRHSKEGCDYYESIQHIQGSPVMGVSLVYSHKQSLTLPYIMKK